MRQTSNKTTETNQPPVEIKEEQKTFVPEVPAQLGEAPVTPTEEIAPTEETAPSTEEAVSTSGVEETKEEVKEEKKEAAEEAKEEIKEVVAGEPEEVETESDEILFLRRILQIQKEGGFGRHLNDLINERIKELKTV